MTLATGARLGAYEILGSLGAGGMGEVYRASDTKLKREVAIKVLPEAFARDEARMKRFEREAQVLASLNHPNVASIYGLEEADGVRALVLELVEGPTLAERIASGPIAVPEALRIAFQIAQGLEAAHEKGVVHRDLKPPNIKLTKDGDVKILDFGLAKALEVEPPPVEESISPTLTRATQVGVLLGTAGYMSPEQAKGKPADRRADVWSFGVVLYEMLTGKRAFAGEDVSETLAHILTKEPNWKALPVELSTRVWELLARCLTKDPKLRLQAIGEARIVLQSKLEDEPKSPISMWPVIAVPVAVALGVALAALWPRSAPSPAPLMRLGVELGTDASLVTNAIDEGQGVLLSPDGTVFVFVAIPAPGALSQLYVRRLDGLEASPLPGTEGARNPFFSPDGQWLAFFAQGKLKKVPVSGGGAVTLSDVSVIGYHGGTWATDGTIVFAQDQETGIRLMRVSAAGGTPEPLPGAGQEVGKGSQSWPQALPKGVLFTLRGLDATTIAFQPLPSGPRKTLVQGGYHGRYLGSGHLVYVREGDLFALPFDLDRMEVIGEPARAVEGVRSIVTTSGAQFASSDRGVLAYVPSAGEESSIRWVERSGDTKPLQNVPGSYFNPVFSPDGRVLAMEIAEGNERDLWAYDWSGDRLTRLTFDPHRDTAPVWTGDGRRIAFASTRAGNETRNLYWLRADGTGEVERLTVSENAQWPGSWHPKEMILAFSEMSPALVRPDILILRMEGSEERGWKPGETTVFVESSFVDNEPAFSPDGRWLAYMSNRTGRFEIYVRPFPGPGGMKQISIDGGRNPVWSASRQELFYYSENQGIMVVAYKAEGEVFDAGKAQPWSAERPPFQLNSFAQFDVHPDGDRIAVVASLTPVGANQNRVVFLLNFFDYLRHIAPPRR